MILLRPTPEAAEAGLRAMKTVACVEGALPPATRALLNAAQTHLLGTELDLDALAPISPEALAEAIPDAALREQFAKALALVSLADGAPSAKKCEQVAACARALGVSGLEVDSVRRLAHRHMLLFRLDFMRRSHIAEAVKHQFRDQGFLETVRAVLGMRGMMEEPALAARYRALAKLPPDTLGHQFIQYLDRNGFAAPGEKHGFPEAAIYHDFTHVLSGYDTDPEGETQIGAFIAGYKKQHPFYVLMFVMLTFGAGVNMTPLPQPHSEGILASPGLADRVFHALERGSKMNVDLSDRWDHWAWVDKPLDEVRRALNIVP